MIEGSQRNYVPDKSAEERAKLLDLHPTTVKIFDLWTSPDIEPPPKWTPKNVDKLIEATIDEAEYDNRSRIASLQMVLNDKRGLIDALVMALGNARIQLRQAGYGPLHHRMLEIDAALALTDTGEETKP